MRDGLAYPNYGREKNSGKSFVFISEKFPIYPMDGTETVEMEKTDQKSRKKN